MSSLACSEDSGVEKAETIPDSGANASADLDANVADN